MGIVLFGAVGGVGVYSSSGVSPSLPARGISPRGGERGRVVSIARAEVGVKELTGKNDGKRIAEYLAYTGIKVPAPYCAAYVSFVFGKAGYSQPRTPWSPAMFPASRIVKEPKPGNLFGIYFSELNRIAHVGLVAEVRGEWLVSYEANSNNNGSRNGDGVYQRLRHKRTVSKYADWIISNKNKHYGKI
ncbi:hypothetical protein J2X78_001212 [Pedobacter africanus]|uniref:Uncharacterized protein n=2 Tax=Pedobacter africanus TaxID=151894 RepID=A0ACC6KTY9_9SPHI|nr:hypothetical protein [Pedobacter africanus]